MPILNLEQPAFISVDGIGRPNAGGTIEVYVADGLFTTFATIYSDQARTTQLTNPVTLDEAGTKEIWYDVKVDIREKTAAGALIRDTLNLDPNASQASVQGFNLAQNGSFEIDSDSDGQPDNWTISPYSGSSIAITESSVKNGTKALEFNTTGAGSGGGTATSLKFPVTESTIVSVSFSFYATNATTLNTFEINWYDHLDVLKGTSTVTMPASGSVPTSWENYREKISVASAATQGEIVLTGIASGGSNLTSKAYFDGISIIAVDSLIYGMVILDERQPLILDTTLINAWSTFDMSAAGGSAADAVAAGATKAILYINSRADTTSANAIYSVSVGKGGTSTTTETLQNNLGSAAATTRGTAAMIITVNLDSNGDFDWKTTHTLVTATSTQIHLLGYYI